ncbi:hypothetical protein EXIGLDRAFT_301090 [Exidia glandulosa HHB12029]|uniref:F-box domain-containing protein n=1 Tax=Exidia glandulosa HHB12029 TaxID=1314781 RepID=A0A165D8A8_EXIGL|nr:hypothetical protein EXIGLDRAFT_301090 [Exidia glandulosa HHB12029]
MSELDPNRYAGLAEAALLRENIETHEATRVALDDRVARAKTALHNTAQALRAAQEAHSSAQQLLDHSTQLKASFEQRLTVSRGLLHPLRRLPDEILAMIFVSVTSVDCPELGAPAPSFAISATCRRWRTVALHTQLMWTCVSYTLEDVRIRDTAAQQRVAACLRMHLSRSKKFPLDVTIDYYVNSSTRCGELWSTISALFEQAQTFVFYTAVDTNSLLSHHLSRPSPHLRELLIDDNGIGFRTADAIRLVLDAPHLTTFQYIGSSIQWHETASCPALASVAFGTDKLALQSLIDLFRSCPKVVTLSAHVLDELTAVEPFNLLADHLETLKLEDLVGPMDMNVARSFSFPALREAEIHITDCSLFDVDAVIVFLRSALSTVTVLHLALPARAGFNFAPGLTTCSQLQRLVLDFSSPLDDPYDIITALSTPGPDGSFLCPHLEILHLSMESATLFSEALVDLATARRRGVSPMPGVPLKIMKIQTYDPSGEHGVALQNRVNVILAS